MKLELNNLSKHYGELKVLDRVSLSPDEIHSLVFIGPSGGGSPEYVRKD